MIPFHWRPCRYYWKLYIITTMYTLYYWHLAFLLVLRMQFQHKSLSWMTKYIFCNLSVRVYLTSENFDDLTARERDGMGRRIYWVGATEVHRSECLNIPVRRTSGERRERSKSWGEEETSERWIVLCRVRLCRRPVDTRNTLFHYTCRTREYNGGEDPEPKEKCISRSNKITIAFRMRRTVHVPYV